MPLNQEEVIKWEVVTYSAAAEEEKDQKRNMRVLGKVLKSLV